MTMIQLLGEWIVRSSILILAGALLLWLLRVKNPSVRLTAWTTMLAGSLSIPLLTVALPKLPLTVLRPAAMPAPAAAWARPRKPAATLPWTASPDLIPAPAPPQTANARQLDRMDVVAMLYMLAAIALLLRLFGALALSLRILHRSRLTGIVAAGVDVRESHHVASPVTIGFLHPAILLPPDWRGWDSAKLDAVLAHEQSHIRRRDPAVQFVSAIHRALLWASPLSWFLDRSIVRTAEQISDDDALAVTRDRVSYAEILLEFVQRGASQTNLMGVQMARYDRPEKRIRRILYSGAIPRKVTHWGIAGILLLGVPLVYMAAAAQPQAAPRRPPLAAAAVLTPAEPASAPVEAPAATPSPNPAPEQAPAPQPPKDMEPEAPASAAQDSAAAPAPPAFEVASVKLKPPSDASPMGAHVYPGGRITIFSVNLKTLIEIAFGLTYSQISGGDEWTQKDLYMVEAKPPEAMQASIKDLRWTWYGIEDPNLRQMLQTLLIDRFQLKFHRETKTSDVFLLERSGKPLRLRTVESRTRPARADGSADDVSFGSPGYVGGKWSIFATSMPQLAKFAYDFVLHVPVIDRTELSGSFDYTQREPDLEPKYGGDQSASFLNYLSEAGLKLERSKGPVETLVIDHAAKPSPN